VVLLAVKILNQMKPSIKEGVHPQIIISHVHAAAVLAVVRVPSLAVHFDLGTPEGNRMLVKTASIAMNSKMIASHQDLFAPKGVDAVWSLVAAPNGLDELHGMITIKRRPTRDDRHQADYRGGVHQSFLVKCVAFKKTFSYAGFEQMTKWFDEPKILLLNVKLELKNEKENAKVHIEDLAKCQSLVNAQWQTIYDKLDS
jgi:T-complex protein 1 subunit eta